MPFRKTLGKVTATLATTAPVLAMVAGIATAHIMASGAGIAAQDRIGGEHPRRAARASYEIGPDMAGPAGVTIAKDRGARAGSRGGYQLVTASAADGLALPHTSRDRVLSRH